MQSTQPTQTTQQKAPPAIDFSYRMCLFSSRKKSVLVTYILMISVVPAFLGLHLFYLKMKKALAVNTVALALVMVSATYASSIQGNNVMLDMIIAVVLTGMILANCAFLFRVPEQIDHLNIALLNECYSSSLQRPVSPLTFVPKPTLEHTSPIPSVPVQHAQHQDAPQPQPAQPAPQPHPQPATQPAPQPAPQPQPVQPAPAPQHPTETNQ